MQRSNTNRNLIFVRQKTAGVASLNSGQTLRQSQQNSPLFFQGQTSSTGLYFSKKSIDAQPRQQDVKFDK